MTSKTAICNKALIKVGAGTSLNIETDDTRKAVLCNLAYDEALKWLLELHAWNFATYRSELIKTDDYTPIYGLKNAFISPQTPRLLRILETENNVNYKRENKYILSDEETLKIRYIALVTDVSLFTNAFIEALALRIATEICFDLTKNSNLVQRLQTEFQATLAFAKENDSAEDNSEVIQESPWLQSRLNYNNNILIIDNSNG